MVKTIHSLRAGRTQPLGCTCPAGCIPGGSTPTIHLKLLERGYQRPRNSTGYFLDHFAAFTFLPLKFPSPGFVGFLLKCPLPLSSPPILAFVSLHSL